MTTLVLFQESTTKHRTGSKMEDPIIDRAGQENSICELKMTSNLKSLHNHDFENVDCTTEDTQLSVGSAHSEHESGSTFKKFSNGITCDSNEEQKDIIVTVNGTTHCASSPLINELDTKSQREPKSLHIDPCKSPHASNNSSDLLTPNEQDTPFSDVVSRVNEHTSCLTTTDKYTKVVSPLKCVVTEPLEKGKIKPAVMESFDEGQSVSGNKLAVTESPEKDDSVHNIKSTATEIFKVDKIMIDSKSAGTKSFEDEIVHGVKSTVAGSYLDGQSVSGTKSFKDDEVMPGIKSTITEPLEEDNISTDVNFASNASFEEAHSVSGVQSTGTKPPKEDEIIPDIKSMVSEPFGGDKTPIDVKSADNESFEDIEMVSHVNTTVAEGQGVSSIKSTVSESCEMENCVPDVKSSFNKSLEEDGIMPVINSTITRHCISDIKCTVSESIEEGHSTTGTSSNSLNESKSIAVRCSPEHSQEITNRLESADVSTKHVSNNAQACLMEGHEKGTDNSRAAAENESVEEMQEEEECQVTARIEDCFTISETEMDCSMNEAEAAEAVKVDEFPKVDAKAGSGPCNVMQSESDKIQSQSLSEQDVNSVDESPHLGSFSKDVDSERIDADSEQIDMDSESTDADTYGIRITDSVTVVGDISADTVNEASNCLEEADAELANTANGSSPESPANCKESTPESGHDVSLIQSKCAGQTKRLDSKTSYENECEKQKTKPELSGDQSKDYLDTKVSVLSSYSCAPDEASKIQMVEGDSCAHISLASTDNSEDKQSCVKDMSEIKDALDCEVMEANDKLEDTIDSTILDKKEIVKKSEITDKSIDTKHSTLSVDDLKKDCEKEGSISYEDEKSHIESVGLVETRDTIDEKETVDNKFETKATPHPDTRIVKFDKMKEEKPLRESEELLSGHDEAGKTEINLDDEIMLLDDSDESEPEAEKYSFKNILQMPKSVSREDISNSEKGRIVVHKTESLNSTKSVMENKPQIALKADEQREEMAVSLVIEEDGDEKMEEGSNEEGTNSDAAVGIGRKRKREEDTACAPKLARLDPTTAKTEAESKEETRGTALEELIDSDDDVILAEEAPVPKIVDEETTKPKEDNVVMLSSEALQSLIALRVRVFIKGQKQVNMDRLNLRTRGMQSASNLWRETAKHLERSVMELAALNQKLGKKYSGAIKLENKSVGIQVGEEKLKSSSTVNMLSSPSNKPVSRSPALITQQPVMRQHVRPGRPCVSHIAAPNIPSTPPQRSSMVQPGRPSQSPNTRPSVAPHSQSNVVNLIDLTDDEDSSRQIVPQTSKFKPTQPGTRTISRLAMGGKTIASSPGNGSIQSSPKAQGTTNNIMSSNNHPHQTPVLNSHSQHFTSGNSGASPVSHYQLVPNNNTAAARPGSFLAVVPGSRPGAPVSGPVVMGKSNVPVNKRAFSQNPAQPVASSAKTNSHTLPPSFHIGNKHPAPLPSGMDAGNAPPTAKNRPPKPGLKISRVSQGIVLSWNMPSLNDTEKIISYQLFAYQESETTIPRSSLWKKVGDVKALPLPMACTLTQFQDGNKYHFAVRAVDQFGRWGSYSDPSSIFLGSKT